jgi:hypothetical protein
VESGAVFLRKSFFVGRRFDQLWSCVITHSRALISLDWFACLSDRRINNFILRLSPHRIPAR